MRPITRPTKSASGGDNDPYRRSPNASRSARGLGFAVATWGVVYLTWRVAQTVDGASLGLFVPLYVAEVALWLRFTLSVLATRTSLAPIELADIRPELDVDLVITTLNDPVELLHMSLVAARLVQGAGATWIYDDGDRREVAELAERLGAGYFCRKSIDGARAGNMNAALRTLTSEYLLFLTAGDVVLPDAITIASQSFRDPTVAVAQLGTQQWNRTAMSRTGPSRPGGAYEDEILRPAHDSRHASPWFAGPSIVRRADLLQIGGFSGRSAVPELNAGVMLQRSGHQIRFIAETLVETPGPRNVQAAIVLEERRAHAILSSLWRGPNPLLSSGITVPQRLAYLAEFLRVTGSFAVLAAILVLILALLTGRAPVAASTTSMALMWGPWILGSVLARVALAKGRLHIGDSVRDDLHHLGAHLRAFVGSLSTLPSYRYLDRETTGAPGMAVAGDVPVLAGLLLATLAAVAVRLADVAFGVGALPDLGGPVAAGAYLSAAMFTFQAATVLGMLAFRPHPPRLLREPDVLARIDDRAARVVAMSPFGATVEMSTHVSTGSSIAMTLIQNGLDGALHHLDLRARIVTIRQGAHGDQTLAVLTFDDVGSGQRDQLIEYCYVVRPIEQLRTERPRALRPAWLAAAPVGPPQVVAESPLASERGSRTDRGVRNESEVRV